MDINPKNIEYRNDVIYFNIDDDNDNTIKYNISLENVFYSLKNETHQQLRVYENTEYMYDGGYDDETHKINLDDIRIFERNFDHNSSDKDNRHLCCRENQTDKEELMNLIINVFFNLTHDQNNQIKHLRKELEKEKNSTPDKRIVEEAKDIVKKNSYLKKDVNDLFDKLNNILS